MVSDWLLHLQGLNVYYHHQRDKRDISASTHQKGLIKLKQTGELFEQLVNTVQPLQEDGTLLAHIVGVLVVATAIPKLMTIVQPLGLYKHLETLWTTRTVVMTQVNIKSIQTSNDNKTNIPETVKLCRLSPLMSCSRDPTGSWRGLQSEVCGPTRLNSAPGQDGPPSPLLNTLELQPSA